MSLPNSGQLNPVNGTETAENAGGAHVSFAMGCLGLPVTSKLAA